MTLKEVIQACKIEQNIFIINNIINDNLQLLFIALALSSVTFILMF